MPHRVLREAHRETSRRQSDARRLSLRPEHQPHEGGSLRKSRWRASVVVRERYARLSYQCSPYHSNSALRPFITNLERRAGFKADDVQATPRQVGSGPCCARSRIEAVAPLFAALLSIPFGSGIRRWRPAPRNSAAGRAAARLAAGIRWHRQAQWAERYDDVRLLKRRSMPPLGIFH